MSEAPMASGASAPGWARDDGAPVGKNEEEGADEFDEVFFHGCGVHGWVASSARMAGRKAHAISGGKVCVQRRRCASALINQSTIKTNELPETEQIRDYVRARYGAIAEQAGAGCGCGPSCCGEPTAIATAPSPGADAGARWCAPSGCGGGKSYGEKLGYAAAELAAVPAGADLGLGCGNPLAIAGIRPGETVLDLGSGGGATVSSRHGNSAARAA